MRDRMEELRVDFQEPEMPIEVFLDELTYVDGSLERMLDAVEAIEILHDKILDSVSSDEERMLVRQYEDVCFECNQVASMIRTKLRALENANPTTNSDYKVRAGQTANVAKKFMDILMRYRKSQMLYQDSQRARMRRQYLIVHPEATEQEMEEALNEKNSSPIFAQHLINGQRHAEAERALKEVEDRHRMVIKLAESIQTLQELFVDMESMVEAQDHLVLEVRDNVDETRQVTETAAKEVETAVKLKKLSRKKCLYIIIAVIVLILLIILIVYFSYIHPLVMKSLDAKISENQSQNTDRTSLNNNTSTEFTSDLFSSGNSG